MASQLNMRIDENRKEEWEKFIEDSPEYETVSALVRASVAREMSSGGNSGENSGTGMGRLNDRLTDIESDIEDLERSMSAIEGKLGRVLDVIEQDQAVADIAPEVFAQMPEFDSKQDAFDTYRNPPSAASTGEVVENYGTVEWLVEGTGFSTQQVEQALDKLQRETARVRTVSVEGETRYWKQV
jgi:hypothetical protein